MMNYYLLLNVNPNYEGVDIESGELWSAESPDDIFREKHGGRSMNYIPDESDVPKPRREWYKSNSAYKQALEDFERNLPQKLEKYKGSWKSQIYYFERYIKKISIPCPETKCRFIQEIDY